MELFQRLFSFQSTVGRRLGLTHMIGLGCLSSVFGSQLTWGADYYRNHLIPRRIKASQESRRVVKKRKKANKTPAFIPGKSIGMLIRPPSRAPASRITAPPEKKPDEKSEYTLFHRTPKHLMRSFNSDNGGITNGPYTLDAGHFQLETELLNFFVFNSTGGTDGALRETNLVINNLILKMGLNHFMDLEIGSITYVSDVMEANHQVLSSKRGLGDLSVLMKINFVGNDGGPFGIGIQPFVKIPTNTNQVGNRYYEGGFFLPINLNLNEDVSLAVMPIFYYNRNLNDSGYHVEGGYSFCLSPKIIGDLAGWFELIELGSTETYSTWRFLSSVGLTYQVTNDFNLDGGSFVGFTGNNPALNPFFGLTVRY